MKKFYHQHRRNIMLQAYQSASVLSIFVYAIFRIIFYEFPMSWQSEASLFVKMFLSSSVIIATATGGIALLYKSLIRIAVRRNIS